MKRLLQATGLTLLTILTMIACVSKGENTMQASDAAEKQAIQSLDWLDAADAEKDAAAAVVAGSMQLLSGGGRGLSLPGIDAEQQAGYAETCGVKILPGGTDTVLGDTHLKYLQKAHEYAAVYNQLIVQHCKLK